MAEQDIQENAMSGGTPARLRGLDANGNSISPALAEVVSAMLDGYLDVRTPFEFFKYYGKI